MWSIIESCRQECKFVAQDYRHENTSVTLINYHFVWIVRRRRKVLDETIEARLKVLVSDACQKLDCEIIALEVDNKDHVHLFLNAPPIYSPAQLMHRIKGYSARYLREEFSELRKLPSMWTRSYFCGTAGNVSGATIKRYVENQKSR